MTLRSVWLLFFFAAPAVASPLCTPVANHMTDERWAPGAATLSNGTTAIIAGGFSYSTGGCVASADIFDETTGRFTPSPARLTYPRDFPGVALLPDGSVLFAGGYNIVLGTLNTAEIYDPATQSFRLLPTRMHDARELFTTTALTDGRVLLCAGFSIPRRTTISGAEIYDPTSEEFSVVPRGLAQDRFGQAAVRLADGRVLIVGGKHWRVGQPDRPLASAEIYDPSTNRFHTTAGSMSVPRDRPTATLLPDGTVLVAGGQNGGAGPLPLELFDPKTERFTTLPDSLKTSRMAHCTAALPGGDIVFAGGWSPALNSTTDTTEIYTPADGLMEAGPTLPVAAHDMGEVQFTDGSVLLAGGKIVTGGKASSSDQGVVVR